MKAAMLKADGSLAVGTKPDPQPAADEILLRVRDCGVCGSDIHAAKLARQFPPDTIMGHEFAGEIAALGASVRGWRAGERVISLPYKACGECPACHRGDGMRCPSLRGIGLGDMPGAFAEFVRVDPKSLLRIPANVGFREAALVEPLAVGLRGVRRSRLRDRMGCVVMGAGPIGLVTLLWAKHEGAETVVVSDTVASRRAMAERLGADAVVDPRHHDPAARVREIGGHDPEIVFECAGVKGTLNAAMAMAPVRAEVVVLGVCMDVDEILPVTGILKELSVHFVLGYTRDEFETALDALSTGRVDAAALITDVVTLDDLPAAFAALGTPTTQGKVLVEF